MHRLLIAASLVALSACSAGAQSPPAPGRGGMMAGADANHDGRVTRAEFIASRGGRCARMDANRDGALDASERPQWGRRAQQANAEDAGRPARGDANGDGLISRAEYDGQAARMFDRLDADHDGAISAAEMQAMREARAQHRAQ
jgi:hypothetical protein